MTSGGLSHLQNKLDVVLMAIVELFGLDVGLVHLVERCSREGNNWVRVRVRVRSFGENRVRTRVSCQGR